MRHAGSDVASTVTDGVATITLNRPDRHNAMRVETYDQLAEALLAASEDASIGVIVLTGAGDKAFSAGGDLSMATTLLTNAEAARHHFMQRMLRVSSIISDSSVPVVARVNGLCVGGGAELVLFTDLVIAAETAYFCFNGTDIGGCSWWGAPQLLPAMVGLRRAEEILYSSRRVPADEAAQIGLINKCVPQHQLDVAVRNQCDQILNLSTDGVRLTKAALRSAREQALLPMRAAAEANVAAVAGGDLQAAFTATLAGERIDWRDRRKSAESRRDRHEVVNSTRTEGM